MNNLPVSVAKWGRAFAPSAEGWWYDPGSGQVKDRKVDTCCFPG